MKYFTKIRGLTPSLQAFVGQPQDQKLEMLQGLSLVLLAATQEPVFAGYDLTMSVVKQRRSHDTGNDLIYVSWLQFNTIQKGTLRGIIKAIFIKMFANSKRNNIFILK